MSKEYDIGAGTVVVAVDGYRVTSEEQYSYVRDLHEFNPRMDLIAWNPDSGYSEVTVNIENRDLGLII